MTSEIRANTLKNRVGLGTVSFTNTGPVVSGIVTANSFSGPLITTSIDLNGDLDVDGHTNLDNLSVAGVSTFTGAITGHDYRSGVGGNTLYLTSADDWRFRTTGGSEKVRITSGGNVGINSITPRGKLDIGFAGAPSFITFGADADNPKVEFFRSTGGSPSHYATEIQQILGDLILSTAATANLGSHSYEEKLRINSVGRVLIGHSQASGDLHGPQGTTGRTPFIQLHGANTSSAGLGLISWKNSAGAYYAPTLYLAHSGSDTKGTNGILPSNGEFGSIIFSGDDGTDFVKGAMIKARLDGTPGNDDMPGRLEFHTTPDGAQAPEERLRIDSSGRLIVGGGTDPAESTIVAKGNSTSATSYSVLDMRRGQAATSAGDVLGYIRFSDTNIPSSNNNYGLIFGACDGASSGAGDNPGRLVFSTTADGASGPTERLRITSNGYVQMNNDVAFLQIGASQDLDLHHNGTNSYIRNKTGDLHIRPLVAEEGIILKPHGAVQLYHDNDLRLQTWSDAVNIYGDEGEDAILHLYADDGDDNNDKWMLRAESSASRFSIENYSTGSWVENIRITAGNMVELKHADGTTKMQTDSTGITVNNRITAGGDSNTYMNLGPNDIIDLYTGGTNLIRMDASGNLGIKQASPQALLHIGNYESTQNVDQSSVTQYFIDSTRSLKIARCDRGSVSNAGWYDVAVLSDGGFTYRCQVSIGGNFTKDVVDIEIQMAYGTTLGNKYSMQIHAKSACAHSNDRIIKVRVAEKSSVFYLQVYLQNVNSQVNGKSVLESTCGIYAQNGADNAYPMFAAASGTYSNVCTTFPDFGVHASWDITVNSSHVRSYTALTGGGQEYITAENAGNGSSHGTVGRFTAPMRGLYQVNLNAKSIINPSRNNQILLSLYGNMTYDAQNVWTTNSEIYDPRGAVTGSQGQQGEGNSWYLRMAAYDYFSIDWYRPAATGYTNGGGDVFNISVLKMG